MLSFTTHSFTPIHDFQPRNSSATILKCSGYTAHLSINPRTSAIWLPSRRRPWTRSSLSVSRSACATSSSFTPTKPDSSAHLRFRRVSRSVASPDTVTISRHLRPNDFGSQSSLRALSSGLMFSRPSRITTSRSESAWSRLKQPLKRAFSSTTPLRMNYNML